MAAIHENIQDKVISSIINTHMSSLAVRVAAVPKKVTNPIVSKQIKLKPRPIKLVKHND